MPTHHFANYRDAIDAKFRDVYTKAERTEYIKAVQCLQSATSITPSDLGSGIKSRFDDFVATQMDQTTIIHLTGNFLSWHRYFIRLYEQDLQEECGYEGTLPLSGLQMSSGSKGQIHHVFCVPSSF